MKYNTKKYNKKSSKKYNKKYTKKSSKKYTKKFSKKFSKKGGTNSYPINKSTNTDDMIKWAQDLTLYDFEESKREQQKARAEDKLRLEQNNKALTMQITKENNNTYNNSSYVMPLVKMYLVDAAIKAQDKRREEAAQEEEAEAAARAEAAKAAQRMLDTKTTKYVLAQLTKNNRPWLTRAAAEAEVVRAATAADSASRAYPVTEPAVFDMD